MAERERGEACLKFYEFNECRIFSRRSTRFRLRSPLGASRECEVIALNRNRRQQIGIRVRNLQCVLEGSPGVESKDNMDPTILLLGQPLASRIFESQAKALIEASEANIAQIESQIRDLSSRGSGWELRPSTNFPPNVWWKFSGSSPSMPH
ncbi:hypothetical protein DFH09DRAFT_1086509 [Mycena vulgaris]|nr:hypothetical protein DFH09DRAFT_1086509 [Mycena vulgaris]